MTNKVLETTTAYKCNECEAISDTTGPALYECECGNTFNRDNGEGQGHQCPECHKFASKLSDQSCSECEQGEVEEVQAFECFCHRELHEV